MSELNTAIITELNNSRRSRILAVERQRIEMDHHGFIAGWLVQIARTEARITQLGGEFEPYEYPGPCVLEKPEQQSAETSEPTADVDAVAAVGADA
jgi:hypothetical protein